MATQPRTAGRRPRDAGLTREQILDAATRDFAERGYSGARVDDIADRTQTTKRMIYYYFGGKEQLYVAVLERAYAAIRAAEQNVDVKHLDPTSAIRCLAELTFDHHEAHPDFIKLVSFENIVRAEHMAKSATLTNLNTPVIDLISEILDRGYKTREFRRRIDPIDLHMMISSFCVFRIANRYTFKTIFQRDLADPALRARYRKMVGDMIVEYLQSEDDKGDSAQTQSVDRR